MLRKLNKLNYKNVKAYRVISPLTNLGKVCEKVFPNMLAEWCDVNHFLHSAQMKSKRQRSAIDTGAEVLEDYRRPEGREEWSACC